MPPQTTTPIPTSPVVDPVLPPKTHSKLPWVILVIVLLLIFGAGGVFLGKQMAGPVVTPTLIVAAPTVPADPTANWKSHTSTSLGITLKYPSQYYLAENPNNQSNLIAIAPEPIRIVVGSDGPPGPIVLSLNQCTNTITNVTTPCDASLEKRLVSTQANFTPDSIKINPNFTVGNKTGYQISGILTDGFLGGAYVKETALPGPNGYILVFSLFNTELESQYDQILSTFKFTDSKQTEEGVQIYNMSNSDMVVYFSSSTATQMKVWTDKNVNAEWTPFQQSLTIPVSDWVYAQYKDLQGNISQTYSDTIHPPAGVIAE